MVLALVLRALTALTALIVNWGDEKILVIPVTCQISAQPLTDTYIVNLTHLIFTDGF